MSDLKVRGAVILVKLSNGSIHQVGISQEEMKSVLRGLQIYSKNNTLSILEEEIDFINMGEFKDD